MKATFVFSVIAVGLVAASIPSTTFSQEDKEQLFSFVKSQALSDAASIYFAASVANRLGHELPNKQNLCSTVSALDENDLSRAFHAYAASRLLGCPAKVSSSLIEKVTDKVDEGENLEEIAQALELYVLLGKDKLAKLEKSAIQSVVNRVAELQHTRGTFRSSADSDDGSYHNSALAWSTLALAARHAKLDDDDLLALITASEGVVAMLKASEASSPVGQLAIPAARGHSSFQVTAAAVGAVTRLAAALDMDLDVTATQIGRLAAFVVAQKDAVHSLADAHALVEAIYALADNTIAVPLAAAVKQPLLQLATQGATGHVILSVTDLFGNFAAPVKVVAVRVTGKGSVAPLLTNQPAMPRENTEGNTDYLFNFFAAKPEPGVYDVEYSITPEGSTKFAAVPSTSRLVKVAAAASIAPLTLTVTDAAGRQTLTESVAKDAAAKGLVVVAADHTLSLVVDVRSASTNKPLRPHQTFVRFEGAAGNEVYLALKANANKQLELSLSPAHVATEFEHLSAKYRVTVIIADANLLSSTVWELGDFHLTFPAPKQIAVKSADAAYHPQPIISHVFRNPEKRPPLTVSSTFSMLVAAPAALLLISLLRIGFNFSGLPGGLGGLTSLAFVGILAATMLTVAAYWFFLSIFEALNLLALIAPVALLVGNHALSSIQATRLGK